MSLGAPAPVCVGDYEERAREALDPNAWAYFAGGAADERTLRANREAWNALWLFVVFNVALAVFNLIPIPPLDGSAILFRVLSPQQAWQVRPLLAQYGLFVLIAVILLLSRPLSDLIFGVATFLVGA